MAGETRTSTLTNAARVFYHWSVKKRTVLPYPPTEISIEPTNRCNFTCSFCPQSSPTHFDKIPASALNPEGVD